VTTAQIVRTMKRGENGSINVSMAPSGKMFVLFGVPVHIVAMTIHAIAPAGRRYDSRSQATE
jgi:hypothetical protein